jgi:Cdc6-like AAA superfamily ATPase
MPDLKTKSSLSERFSKNLFKIIWRNALNIIVIATVSATISFLVATGDIPKLVLAGMIGAFMGGVSALSYSFINPISRKAKQLAEDQASATVEAIELRVSSILFEKKYFECQALVGEEFRTEGLRPYDGIFIPLLEEVFVPLKLSLSTPRTNSNESTKDILLEIWDVLRRAEREPTFRQIGILAEGGSGKTMLLKHITYVYSKHQQQRYKVPKKIPVLLMLREYIHILTQDIPPSLPELINEYHIPKLPGSEKITASLAWLKAILRDGRVVIMLDGFDEVPNQCQALVSEWINLQIRSYPRTIFIIASRPEGYRNGYVEPQLSTTFWIQPFGLLQQERFVQQWYFSQEYYARGGGEASLEVERRARQFADDLILQISQRSELNSATQNPLLLTMIANVYRSSGSLILPQRQTQIYKAILELQLSSRPLSKKIDVPLVAQESQFLLQCIALNMTIAGRETMPEEFVVKILETSLVDIASSINPQSFLKYVSHISGLFVEAETGQYQFSHRIFQTYLTAIEICVTGQEHLLIEHSEDDSWKEIILLYIDQLQDPRGFFRKLFPPIANPYVAGNPVQGRLFVGREDILDRFRELWSNPYQIPSIVLYGHRRMGKTSILRNLSEHLNKGLVVDFNMQRVGHVGSTSGLLYNLALAIYYTLSKNQHIIDEPQESDFLERNPMTSFDRFLKKVDDVRDRKKIIITIDEFEIIENLIEQSKVDSQILDFWRSLIQTYSWFVLVFAGLHTLNEMTRDYWNPLFGSVQVIPVSYLSKKATESLIRNPSPNFNLVYTRSAVDLIYNLTYGQPYLVQHICHTLVAYFSRERSEKGFERKHEMTPEDIEVVVHMPEFYRNSNAYFDGIWEQAKEVHGEEQIQILNAISQESLSNIELSQKIGVSLEKINTALGILVQHDVIQQQGNSYNYRVELMRRWVVRKQPRNFPE